jgi:23S rRNA (adenine2030-N6)-methyltransferase
MLSYQHLYHAGNLADVHKHAALAWMLAYLTAKPKPISYIETHAGRGLYDLSSPEALKTGEAEAGIARLEPRLPPDHPYRKILAEVRARHGKTAYPGSPLVAALSLRPTDTLRLAELHPQEYAHLRDVMRPYPAEVVQRDGWDFALAVTPPTPRRGLMLIDPSFEVKSEYARAARVIPQLARKWNVGVIALWYPILADAPHAPMLAALKSALPGIFISEVRFPPARETHRMQGSGLAVVNPPWGLADQALRLQSLFR